MSEETYKGSFESIEINEGEMIVDMDPNLVTEILASAEKISGYDEWLLRRAAGRIHFLTAYSDIVTELHEEKK
jgi:hypothetical protein|tara:strand:+ start:2255 stop:2473 length:219 start_codon:yes stop_codon:yes gene_type:complete